MEPTFEFDPQGWIEHILSDEQRAYTFCEDAVFRAVWDALAKRDKTYFCDGISDDQSKREEWRTRHTLLALEVYQAIAEDMGFLPPQARTAY